MKRVIRNLWGITATATALAVISMVLAGCVRSGTPSQPVVTVPVNKTTGLLVTSEPETTVTPTVTVAASATSSPPTAESESTPEAQTQELSTPELIEQAFAKGEITAEQRLLYLAYAVGDYEKLPARYRGNVPWRSTLTRLELTEAVTSPSSMCSLSPFVQSELRRVLTVGVTCDP